MEPKIITVPDDIKSLLLYDPPEICTPFHNKVKLVFADVIASGRACPLIEKYVQTKILPYYSNTHSNAYCGGLMKTKVNNTKEYIRKIYNIDYSKNIIFTGSGTTGAINHLLHCLKLNTYPNVSILVSSLEHHSNYLPWVELTKRSNNIKLIVIPMVDLDIDLEYIDRYISENHKTINIISITACSNVLGTKIDISRVKDILDKYNCPGDKNSCCYGKNNLLFVDYACGAPYYNINGANSDAFFFSPHKFLGGTSTPGVLVADRRLFQNEIPFTPGGGCVRKVCSNTVEYEKNIEKKEMAGTPNIIGIIKIKKILQLQQMFIEIIKHNEKEIARYVFHKFIGMQEKSGETLQVIYPCYIEERLPIVCISIIGLHYNLLVALLSDLFGIQTRGGVSCTGILAESLNKKYNIDGWCRLSFNWLMYIDEIDYILDSVDYLVNHWKEYSKYYKFDVESNLFIHHSILASQYIG